MEAVDFDIAAPDTVTCLRVLESAAACKAEGQPLTQTPSYRDRKGRLLHADVQPLL